MTTTTYLLYWGELMVKDGSLLYEKDDWHRNPLTDNR